MYTVPFPVRSRVDDLFNELDRLTRQGWSGSATPVVPVSVWADDERIAVTAEVAGVAQADLAVEATHDTLTISGVRKAPIHDENTAWISRERATDRFTRTIALPWQIDPDAVEARLANGVLTIALRRAASDRPRRIEVAA